MKCSLTTGITHLPHWPSTSLLRFCFILKNLMLNHNYRASICLSLWVLFQLQLRTKTAFRGNRIQLERGHGSMRPKRCLRNSCTLQKTPNSILCTFIASMSSPLDSHIRGIRYQPIVLAGQQLSRQPGSPLSPVFFVHLLRVQLSHSFSHYVSTMHPTQATMACEQRCHCPPSNDYWPHGVPFKGGDVPFNTLPVICYH